MIGLVKRFGAGLPAAAVFAALLFAPARAEVSGSEGTITVLLDRAILMKVPDRVATIVVGNPLIADATLQSGNIAVLTGKGYGVTNILVLDRAGAVLAEKIIQVKDSGKHLVTVYRGVQRESYDCAPKCEPRNTLGDGQAYFTNTLNQIATRSSLAQGFSSEK